jgi:hypothetical protein
MKYVFTSNSLGRIMRIILLLLSLIGIIGSIIFLIFYDLDAALMLGVVGVTAVSIAFFADRHFVDASYTEEHQQEIRRRNVIQAMLYSRRANVLSTRGFSIIALVITFLIAGVYAVASLLLPDRLLTPFLVITLLTATAMIGLNVLMIVRSAGQ